MQKSAFGTGDALIQKPPLDVMRTDSLQKMKEKSQ
jgi:hypothetical protein